MYAIAALFSSLLDAATGLLEQSGFAASRRSPYLLVLEGQHFRLYRIGKATPQLKAEGDISSLGKTLLPQGTRSSPVEVRIDARDCIVRILTLPRTSRSFIGSILSHQIERLTPWTLESVAYDWSEAGSTKSDIEIRIVAAARTRVEADMDRLEQSGLHLGRMGISSDPIERLSPIDLLGRGREGARQRLRRIAAASLIFAGSGALAASIGSGLYVGRLQAEVERHQSVAEVLRTRMADAVAASRPQTPGITGRKLATFPMVLALDRLSAALPTDSFLTELRLEDGKVAIAGMATEAALLVGVLEATDFLADVHLSSPTASDPVTGKERFSIEAALEEVAR